MNASRTLLAAAALLGLSGAAAIAAPLTVSGTGENFAVQYDATYSGNIVGGGIVASETRGKDNRVVYANPNHVRMVGIPVQAGGSEGEVSYLPPALSSVWMASR
jgi:hypothetical protein